MALFGLYFCDNVATGVHVPKGFARAEVHLGDHIESVFCGLSLWSREDYLQAWRASARAMKQPDAVQVFCDDFGQTHCSLWCGAVDGDGADFIHLHVPKGQLVVQGVHIIAREGKGMLRHDLPGATSHWRIPLDLVAVLAG